MVASHCLAYTNGVRVSLVKVGMLKRIQNDSNTDIYNVAEIFQHPEYSKRTINNDVALLRLSDNIKFSDKIYPICLPSKQHSDSEAIVTGFGKTGVKDSQADNLLKVGLQFFTFAECQGLYRLRRLNQSTMICYGHRTERKDACEVGSNLLKILLIF